MLDIVEIHETININNGTTSYVLLIVKNLDRLIENDNNNCGRNFRNSSKKTNLFNNAISTIKSSLGKLKIPHHI